MAFRPRLSSLGVVLALGAGCLLPVGAGAVTMTTAPVAFSGSASVSGTEGGGATTDSDRSLGSSAIAQFDSDLGVLMGATLNLSSTRTQTVWVTATAGGGTSANFDVTTNGQGASTARIVAPGVAADFSSVSASDSCTGKWKNDCTGTATSSPATATSLAGGVPDASLDSYVGSGTVTVARTAPALTASQLSGVFSGTETTTSTVTWAGTLGATYEYLLHAAPSFGDEAGLLTLDLDFGDVFQGDLASQSFEIFNLGLDRVALDLDSITGSGDVTRLFTDLSAFAGLVSGDGDSYRATLDTTALGSFAATYLLGFSDADVGAASSRRDFLLTLKLSGNVVARQPDVRNSVPEPATFALFSLGIAAIPFVRRRRTPA